MLRTEASKRHVLVDVRISAIVSAIRRRCQVGMRDNLMRAHDVAPSATHSCAHGATIRRTCRNATRWPNRTKIRLNVGWRADDVLLSRRPICCGSPAADPFGNGYGICGWLRTPPSRRPADVSLCMLTSVGTRSGAVICGGVGPNTRATATPT